MDGYVLPSLVVHNSLARRPGLDYCTLVQPNGRVNYYDVRTDVNIAKHQQTLHLHSPLGSA